MTPLSSVARATLAAALALALSLVPVAAGAQPREGRIQVGGGLLWIGPAQIAETPATQVAPGGQSRTVFGSETRREASLGGVIRLSARITSRMQIETAFTHSPGTISTQLTGDAEAASVTAHESVTRDLLEGGVVLSRSHNHERRFAPFASAGAGYVRLLHEARTLSESGQMYYAGGGAVYLLRPGVAGIREAGLRFDGRAVVDREHFSGERFSNVEPLFGVSLFVGF
jgi:hypothetical protein